MVAADASLTRRETLGRMHTELNNILYLLVVFLRNKESSSGCFTASAIGQL